MLSNSLSKNTNIFWVQYFKCEHVPLFLILYQFKINIFGYWTAEDNT